MLNIGGKKTLITGAASGIGRALALALAAARSDLFLLDIDEDGLDETACLARDLGVEVVTAACDLLDADQVTKSVRAILCHWERIDILINNAGVLYYGPTHRMTSQEWDWVLGVNLRAPLQLIHELLPTLLAQDESHIVNIASIAGLVAGNRMAAYHATKFAMVGLSESLRHEYAAHGLGVTTVCPGFVKTALFDSARVARSKPLRSPPNWLCTTPEVVAQKTLQAIRGNRAQVLITPLAHALWYAKRLVPWLLPLLSGCRRNRAAPLAQPRLMPLAGPSPLVFYRRSPRTEVIRLRAQPIRTAAA